MKNKKLRILWIIILLLMIVTAILVFVKKNNKRVQAEKFEKNVANYIWDGSTENNTWMCFRKTFSIAQNDIQDIVAQIAVDSKYWLYINGEMVIREGALKRGEAPDSIYYDEVDLSDYLKAGENTIAILVWYWGDTSLSHASSGQGALLFKTKIGNQFLVSDDTWKIMRNPAYLQDELRPNNRLIEYNVFYDATLEIDNWYQADYDDSTWENATILGKEGASPWGNLIKRDIPQFKDFGLKDYENSSDYMNYTTTEDEILKLKLPYNAQITPYLELEAKAGQKITIKTDFYEDVSGDSVKCTYLTKEGKQEFESLAWMNGENVYYEIPEGVKIISLKYRETGYDTEMTGKFTSDDEFFNKLWQMSARTLYVNMRDSYMDCPNRERAQWWGNTSIEMLEAMYALDTSAYDLYEKGVKTTIGWKIGKIMPTVTPIGENTYYLPVQMLLGIDAMYEYYEYTGKNEFLEYIYPHIKEFLELWEANEENGLMYKVPQEYPAVWEWADSAIKEYDYTLVENAWYYLALKRTCQIAEILGYEEDKANLGIQLQNLKESYNQLWTEGGYKMPESSIVDERANAIAVISGLADEAKYNTISNLLINSYNNGAFIEKYILQALCEMGKIEEVQNRIKDRYHEMVDGKQACSTLWERWNVETGTKNHAWSGGPLIIMSKYFAGIKALESGYEIASIKPNFGKLTQMNCEVTTVKGDIKFKAQKTENKVSMKIDLPTKGYVAVPKVSENPQILINNNVVYEEKKSNQSAYDKEDKNYIYFYLEKGKYEIECKS